MPTTIIFTHAGPESPKVLPGQVFWIRQPEYPELRFEWHPVTKKVYVGRTTPGGKVMGELICAGVDNRGFAENIVLVWLRGYRTKAMEVQAPDVGVRGLIDS
jgi:hypothetical protein